jgi:E3 ubiquitin-protein ligase DOA10
MKQSDSTNSLTELNKDDPTCFVCLEIHTADLPLIDSAVLRSCGCKFSVHAPCWNEWIKQGKSDYDCPICGKRSLHMGLILTAPFQVPVVPEPVLTLTRDGRCSTKCLYSCIGLCIVVFVVLAVFMIRKL